VPGPYNRPPFFESPRNAHPRIILAPPPRVLAAARAAQIQPFEVMEVLARANELERSGRRIVRMEIGEPDFTAPGR
jgi:aspartate/methionine/tyrosine aminotransferase